MGVGVDFVATLAVESVSGTTSVSAVKLCSCLASASSEIRHPPRAQERWAWKVDGRGHRSRARYGRQCLCRTWVRGEQGRRQRTHCQGLRKIGPVLGQRQ